MKRIVIVGGAVVGILAGTAFAVRSWLSAQEAKDVEVVQQARVREEQAQRSRDLDIVRAVRNESETLMPEQLRGLQLGMSRDELTRLRPKVRSSPVRDPKRLYIEEQLENGAQVMYGLDPVSGGLIQVQILSLLPNTAAITPHLGAMSEKYGRPTGVWDCAQTDETLPMRRFTWRKRIAGVMEALLIFRDQVSTTLYIAPNEVLAESLQDGRCSPTPRDRVDNFPVTTEEMMASHKNRAIPSNRDAGTRPNSLELEVQ